MWHPGIVRGHNFLPDDLLPGAVSPVASQGRGSGLGRWLLSRTVFDTEDIEGNWFWKYAWSIEAEIKKFMNVEFHLGFFFPAIILSRT